MIASSRRRLQTLMLRHHGHDLKRGWGMNERGPIQPPLQKLRSKGQTEHLKAVFFQLRSYYLSERGTTPPTLPPHLLQRTSDSPPPGDNTMHENIKSEVMRASTGFEDQNLV